VAVDGNNHTVFNANISCTIQILFFNFWFLQITCLASKSLLKYALVKQQSRLSAWFPLNKQTKKQLLLAIRPSCKLRASPAVVSSVCNLAHKNWAKKSQNILGLAQKNGFDPAFLQSLLTLVKCTAKPNTCQRRV
jgi:hypothetical protein